MAEPDPTRACARDAYMLFWVAFSKAAERAERKALVLVGLAVGCLGVRESHHRCGARELEDGAFPTRAVVLGAAVGWPQGFGHQNAASHAVGEGGDGAVCLGVADGRGVAPPG